MDTDSQELALQKYLPHALQIPALIAGLSLFFGSALLLGKCIYLPGLIFRASLSDVISEAIVITPLGIAFMLGVGTLGTTLHRIITRGGWIKHVVIYARTALHVASTSLTAVAIYYGNLRIAAYLVILSYISVSVATFARALSRPVEFKKLSGEITILIICTYIFIAMVGCAYSMTVYRTSDNSIKRLGSQICFEKCHPGLVLATTSSTVAVRFWGDPRVHYYPADALKEYVYRRSLIYSDSYTISDFLDEYDYLK